MASGVTPVLMAALAALHSQGGSAATLNHGLPPPVRTNTDAWMSVSAMQGLGTQNQGTQNQGTQGLAMQFLKEIDGIVRGQGFQDQGMQGQGMQDQWGQGQGVQGPLMPLDYFNNYGNTGVPTLPSKPPPQNILPYLYFLTKFD